VEAAEWVFSGTDKNLRLLLSSIQDLLVGPGKAVIRKWHVSFAPL
jgi:hypothetical protein